LKANLKLVSDESLAALEIVEEQPYELPVDEAPLESANSARSIAQKNDDD